MFRKIASAISLLLAITLLTAMPANAAVPSLTSISPTSGTVSGGTNVTLTGTDFTGATGATIGGVAATNFTVVDATTITMTTPLRSGVSRQVGRYPVVVQHADGNSSELVYFDYSPQWDVSTITVGSSSAGRVVLGDLASRSQNKPIVRNATTPPLTVTGTDSNTGETYSYVFERRFSTDFTGDGAYNYESDESVSTNLTTGYDDSASFDGRNGVLELSSRGNCTRPSQNNPSDRDDGPYCAIFGPDVYTQAFYAEQGQSVSFDWAASDSSDAFEFYAFLVSAANLTDIPTAAISNHTIATHAQGGVTSWRSDTATIPADGYYRLRVVNGTYDETGGLLVGGLTYLDDVVSTGLANEISFGPFSDWVTTTSGDTQTITASATSGAQVTIVSNDTSVCTVGSPSHSGSTTTYTVTRTGSATGECDLTAYQGATGLYAPAAYVFRAFTIRTTATTPTAPFITGITGGDAKLTVSFIDPARDGGANVTNYEYRTDSDAWLALSPADTDGTFTILTDSDGVNLANGTTYAITLRGINTEGSGATSNSVNGTPNVPAAPDIADYSATLGAGLFGTILAPTNSGGAIESYSVSPALPTGLTLNTTTGVISGSVAAEAAATGYTITATNTGVGGAAVTDTAILTLTITSTAPPAISYAGSPYRLAVNSVADPVTPTSSGGVVTSYALTSGTLPAGLSLNTSTGVISGTPTTLAAAVSLTVTATGSYGSDTDTFTIEIVTGEPLRAVYTGPLVEAINPSALPANSSGPATLTGVRLGQISSLSVNGLAIQIVSQSEIEIRVIMPSVAAGVYDLNAVLGGGAALTVSRLVVFIAESSVADDEVASVDPIRVVITGFRPGISTPSAFQTNKLKAAIAAIDEPITGMTCIGFTNGPTILPVDPAVALARGEFICDYLKELLPDIPQKLTYKNTTYPSVHWRRAEVYFSID